MYSKSLKKDSKEEETNKQERLLEAERVIRHSYKLQDKWIAIFQSGDFDVKKNRKKIKKLARKGIPNTMRGLIWSLMVQEYERKQKAGVTYQSLLRESKNSFHIISAFDSIICRDIPRTFPKHMLFRENFGYGQKSLYRILRAYSLYNIKDIGYCQGMGFISACLLNFFNEEDCFWMLVSCIDNFRLHGFLSSDMPLLSKSFYKYMVLVKKYLPQLYEKFYMQKIHPSMYASGWFITLFTINFPFDILCRIWDLFLLQGMKIIFKIAIALLTLFEKDLLSLNFEDTMDKFQSMYNEVEKNTLMQCAIGLKITNKILEALDKEYEEGPNREILNSFCFEK